MSYNKFRELFLQSREDKALIEKAKIQKEKAKLAAKKKKQEKLEKKLQEKNEQKN